MDRHNTARLNGASEQGIMEAEHVPPWLHKLKRRIQALPRSQTYIITLRMPEHDNKEPVWQIAKQGEIENDRGQRT